MARILGLPVQAKIKDELYSPQNYPSLHYLALLVDLGEELSLEFFSKIDQHVDDLNPDKVSVLLNMINRICYRIFVDRTMDYHEQVVLLIETIASNTKDPNNRLLQLTKAAVLACTKILNFEGLSKAEKDQLENQRNAFKDIVRHKMLPNHEAISSRYHSFFLNAPYIYYYLGDLLVDQDYAESIDRLDEALLTHIAKFARINEQIIVLANRAPSHFDKNDYSSALIFIGEANFIAKQTGDRSAALHTIRFEAEAMLLGGISDPKALESLRLTTSNTTKTSDKITMSRLHWAHQVLQGELTRKNWDFFLDLTRQIDQASMSFRNPIPFPCLALLCLLESGPSRRNRAIKSLSQDKSASIPVSTEILEAFLRYEITGDDHKFSHEISKVLDDFLPTPIGLITAFICQRLAYRYCDSQQAMLDAIDARCLHTLAKGFFHHWHLFSHRLLFFDSFVSRSMIARCAGSAALDLKTIEEFYIAQKGSVESLEELAITLCFAVFCLAPAGAVTVEIDLHAEIDVIRSPFLSVGSNRCGRVLRAATL